MVGDKIKQKVVGIFDLVLSLVILVVFLGYTFIVAKASAQVAVNSHGNPIKQKALKVMLGVEPPEESKLFGFDLKALREGRCVEKEEQVVEPAPATEATSTVKEAPAQQGDNNNQFYLALLDVIEKARGLTQQEDAE